MGIVEGEADHTGLSRGCRCCSGWGDDGSFIAAGVIPSVIAWRQYLTRQTEKTLQGQS
jgi:hypothetical protein